MATPRDFGYKNCLFMSQTQGVNGFSDPKKGRPNLGALFCKVVLTYMCDSVIYIYIYRNLRERERERERDELL